LTRRSSELGGCSLDLVAESLLHEPMLFHTGMRWLHAGLVDAVSTVVPPEFAPLDQLRSR
jgi:hypothetical protein